MVFRAALPFLVLLFAACQTLRADETQFTQAEREQVNIPTEGLFDEGNVREIHLSLVGDEDFCFPVQDKHLLVMRDGDDLKLTPRRANAVKAMFEGDVRLSYLHPEYGNIIVIRHANGLETVYADNAHNLVFSGEHVRAGQTIAIVGGEGQDRYCTFSLMLDGHKFNPTLALDLDTRALRRVVLRAERTPDKLIISSRSSTPAGEGLMAYTDEDPFAAAPEIVLNLADIPSDRKAYPLPGAKVISPYGGARKHSGVDLKTVPKDKVLAAFEGVVVMSAPYAGYGNCIKIKHACGLMTLYSHQYKNLVQEGDFVHAGQVIGLTGRTGRATTEHLHFELYCQGKRYDPARLFDHTNHKLRDIKVVITRSGEIKTIK
ncbi:MAG: M23 family metallopeptidase [Prevotella sp.]|nr:M23 family metallopeptidase [Prevotella sp.]